MEICHNAFTYIHDSTHVTRNVANDMALAGEKQVVFALHAGGLNFGSDFVGPMTQCLMLLVVHYETFCIFITCLVIVHFESVVAILFFDSVHIITGHILFNQQTFQRVIIANYILMVKQYDSDLNLGFEQ